jgi:hypothetical protein
MPPHPSGRLPATFRRLLLLALLLPLAVLVVRYKSLWYDEAALGINIVTRSYSQLFEPLSYLQVAPIGFLLLAKLSNAVLGHNDFAIRLPSLAAYLCLFAALARRADRSPGQLLRLVLIVASPAVLRYAFELKQYISDVLLMVVLLEFGGVVFSRAGRALLFSALAVALSNVALIQVPIFALLAGLWQARSGVPRRTVALRLAAVAIPLGAYYFAFVAHHPSQAGMIAYWATELPFGPGHHENPVMFFARRLFRIVRFSYLTPAAAVLWLFYLAGLLRYLRERQYPALAATTLPILGHCAFATLSFYPFDAGRLTLYLIVPMAAGAADGLIAVLGMLSARFAGIRRYRLEGLAGWAVVAAVLGNGLGYAVLSKRKEHIRPIYAMLETRPKNARGAVPLHFLPKSTMQFKYYAAQAHAVGRGFLEGYPLSRDTDWEPFLRDALTHRRVAAILSHSRDLFGGRPFSARQVAEEVTRRLRERDPSDAHGLRLGRVSWANGAALIEVEQSGRSP